MEHISVLATGDLAANTYIIALDAQTAAVIDPGSDGARIVETLHEQNLRATHIVLTHGHFDHIGALGDVKKAFPDAKVLIHKDDAFCIGEGALQAQLDSFADAWPGAEEMLRATIPPLPAPDAFLAEGDVLFTGSAHFANGFTVFHTSGHSKGSICLYNKEKGVLISGDTVFADGFGRTDFAGGDSFELMQSLSRLSELPRDTVILSGHGPVGVLGKNQALGV